MKIKPGKSFWWVALSVVALLGIEYVWLHASIEVAEREFDKDIQIRLEKVTQTVEEDALCFELFSRHTLQKGASFFLMAPDNQSENLALDTLEHFYWNSLGEDTLFSIDHLQFTAPVSVEVNLKFNYLGSLISQHPDSLNQLERGIKNENKNAFVVYEDSLEYKLFDTVLLDTTLAHELANLKGDFTYGYAVIEKDSKKVLVGSAFDMAENLPQGIALDFFSGENFRKPLQLLVWFPNKRWNLLLSYIPIASLYLLLVFGIAVALWVTLRTTARQRALATMQLDLVNNMTHEFNTPIANINLALETLRRGPQTGSTLPPQRILEIIEAENQRLKENIDRVVNATLIDEKQVKLERSPVDIHELLNELIQRFDLVLHNKNGAVKTLLKATNSRIVGDPIHLTNAFYNLIDNAIKYSKGPAQVEIETIDDQDGIRLVFRDHGIGIEPSNLQFIFDRFFRVHTSNQHDVKGFGIGLYYVNSIVKAHLGTIDVNSHLGEGTTFQIHLPGNG